MQESIAITENGTNIRLIPDDNEVQKATYPFVINFIARNVLYVEVTNFFSLLPNYTSMLKSWAPLSTNKRNAEDANLLKKVKNTIEQIDTSITIIEKLTKQIQGIKDSISQSPMQQAAHLPKLAEVQQEYKHHTFILNEESINLLLDELQKRILSDNQRKISPDSIDLIVRCHDITKEQFENQLKHFHENTNQFETLKSDLYLRKTKLINPGIITTSGVLPAFKSQFDSVYGSIMNGSIGYMGSCIKGVKNLWNTTSHAHSIDIVNLSDYLKSDLSFNENSQSCEVIENTEIFFEYLQLMQKCNEHNTCYSEDYDAFVGSITGKLKNKACLKYDRHSDLVASASIDPQSLYKEVYFWDKIPFVRKRVLDTTLEARAHEMSKSLESIASKVNKWAKELSSEDLPKGKQSSEKKDTVAYLLDEIPEMSFLDNPSAEKALSKEQKIQKYQGYVQSFAEMTAKEIAPVFEALQEIKKDLLVRTALIYRKQISANATLLVTAAFDTTAEWLAENFSSFHMTTDKLKQKLEELGQKQAIMSVSIENFRCLFEDKCRVLFPQDNNSMYDWGLSLIGLSPKTSYIDFGLPDSFENEIKGVQSQSPVIVEDGENSNPIPITTTTTTTTTTQGS